MRPRIPGRGRFPRLRVAPLTRRRLRNFRANRRGYWSFWIFAVLFVLSLFAEFIANDKPILVAYRGELLMPVFTTYPETRFGGDFETEADYRDPFVTELIEAEGRSSSRRKGGSRGRRSATASTPSTTTCPFRRPRRRRPRTGSAPTTRAATSPLARAIYGFRISVLFGLALTVFSSVIGVVAGAAQGYFGGWLDLLFQRFMEMGGRDAGAVPPDHPGVDHRAGVLDSARPDAVVQLDGACRRGARRVPARAQLRVRAGGAGARRR